MDAEQHAARVAQVTEWLAAHGTNTLSVTVHTGANVVPVAAGPLIRLEEHPQANGVFRAIFEDARRVSLNPDEEQYISFGAELQGVEAAPDRLVLDKGVQFIEIVDLDATVLATADEVTWPVQGEPDAVPTTAPTPPTFAAPSAIAPPPAAAPPPSVAVPVAAVVPPPPPPPPPAATVAPPSAAQGQILEMQVKAPFYDNSMGSAFYGPATIRIEQGLVTFTGHRAPGRTMMATGGVALGVLGALSLAFGLIVAGGATGDSDMGFAFCLMGVGLLFILPGIALFLVGRARAKRGELSTIQFRTADAHGLKVRWDTNLGCLLSLVLTPLVGLIVVLVRGRRVVNMSIPNDRGPRPARQMLAIRAYSAADGAILDAALRGSRMR